jgi:hypothetical protein
MRRALEPLMYVAFSVAALPLAWLGLSQLLYYRAHPEMLEVRDAALEVGAVLIALPFVGVALLIALGLAAFVFRFGPFIARVNGVILVIAWVAAFFAPETAFRSFARLYWEALPFAALVALPWVCAAVRLAFTKEKVHTTHNDVRSNLSA